MWETILSFVTVKLSYVGWTLVNQDLITCPDPLVQSVSNYVINQLISILQLFMYLTLVTRRQGPELCATAISFVDETNYN